MITMIIIILPEIKEVIFAAPDHMQNRPVPPELLHASVFFLHTEGFHCESSCTRAECLKRLRTKGSPDVGFSNGKRRRHRTAIDITPVRSLHTVTAQRRPRVFPLREPFQNGRSLFTFTFPLGTDRPPRGDNDSPCVRH